MSSILNKFRKQPQNDTPAGIKIENTLFGQQNGTYQPPLIPVVQLPQTTQPRQKGRPGGGWDDEEPQQQQQQILSSKQTNNLNLINDTPPKQNENKANIDVLLPPQSYNNNIQLSRVTEYKKGQLLNYEELEIGGFEFEFHQVEEATKLGGIKLKQSDSVLKEFARACQTLQEQLIGSILLNKLYSEENWKVQIRCIYAIQFISQQYQNYREFFQINQNYLKIDTDQQILQSAIEQTLLEINGQQSQKQKEFQFEFREPPKQQQNIVQQQPNLIEIGNNEVQQKQPQQQKLDLKSLKIKQPQAQQQPQQQLQQQQNQQKNKQIDLLEAFSEISIQNYDQNQNQNQNQYQQQQQQKQQQQQQGISFDEILNTQSQSQPGQQPQQKKNAFGFLKKDQQQQAQQQQPQQQKQEQTQLNTLLLQDPQQLYQQQGVNPRQVQYGQPQNLYNVQQQPVSGQLNYSQAFAQFNMQQQQYNIVQQTQFTQEQPKQKQQPNPKDNAFDFLNF